MPTPADQVDRIIGTAEGYATALSSDLSDAVTGLSTYSYTLPTIANNWGTGPTAPGTTVPGPPDPPADYTWHAPQTGGESNGAPTNDLVVTIDDWAGGDLILSTLAAPALSIGMVPTVPDIGAVTVPTAPGLPAIADPAYLALNVVTFAGLNLHEDWLLKLDTIPTVDLVSPTPFSHVVNDDYVSWLETNLKGRITAGGTGLPVDVEQAIWDRARSRETQTALANESEILRQSEALGYVLPAGATAAQLREAQQAYYDKLSTLSRDVAVKQAELEQENVKTAITSLVQIEGQLIDHAWKIEQLAFESAKEYAENAIKAYNSEVEGYKAMLTAYQTYATVYKTLIDAEVAKVEVYKGELQAEKTKADMNTALVQQYKAKIDAQMATVEIYKAELEGAKTLVALESAKVSAAGERVKGYIAQVNAETAKVERFKAEVQAEVAKTDVFKAKAQVFSAKVGAQAEKAKAEATAFDSEVKAYVAQWEGYNTKVRGEAERLKAVGMSDSAKYEAYKGLAQSHAMANEAKAKFYQADITNYQGKMNHELTIEKFNIEKAVQEKLALLEAAKVEAQVLSQAFGASIGALHATAGVSGSGSTSVSYSYSNDTTSAQQNLAMA